MKKLSIIVPIYNCKDAYLRRCLNCFVNAQTDLELILVDDGSKEYVSSIIHEYKDLIPGLIVIRQSNKGVSVARNAGINMASGKWVVFCDADDEINVSILSEIVNDVSLQEFDFIYTNYEKVSNKGSIRINLAPVFSKNQYLEKMLYEPNLYGTCWAKLFSLKYLKENNIRFDEVLSHSEDSLFLMSVLLSNQARIINLDKTFYTYHVYSESSAKNSIFAVDKYTLALEKGKQLILKYGNELIGGFEDYCCTQILIVLTNIIFQKGRSYRESKKAAEEFRNREIISAGLKNLNKAHLSLPRKFVILQFANRRYFWCYLAAIVRRLIR